MHHKSKQRRQKAWGDGVAPGDNALFRITDLTIYTLTNILSYIFVDGSRSEVLLTRFENALTGINDANLLYNSAVMTTIVETSEDQCIGSCLHTTNCGAAFVAFSNIQGQTFQWCALLQMVDTSIKVIARESVLWAHSWGASMPMPVASSLIVVGKRQHNLVIISDLHCSVKSPIPLL